MSDEYDLRESYTQELARSMGKVMDFEVYWSMDDGGLGAIASQIKKATGSNQSLFDKRSWHGKWYAQNYHYYRQLVWYKLAPSQTLAKEKDK